MIVKLTNYSNGKTTLVNLDNVECIYQIYNKTKNNASTKICFRGNDSFVTVREDLQTIMKIQQNMLMGIFQDTNWVTPDFSEEKSWYEQLEQHEL
jgi:hypothetical protein